MKSVQVEELSKDVFEPYGSYTDMLNPTGPCLGEGNIRFYRDMIPVQFGGGTLTAFSNCRVEPREMVVDASEFHHGTCEGLLPLDGDMLMHVMPASAGDKPPVDDMQVFRVPQGTLCILRPGVWHHAPFAVADKPLNILIVLPERTYAIDCVGVPLDADQQVRVET